MALLTMATPAAADDAREPANEQSDRRADAERLFRAGEQAYRAGEYLAAARAFEESYRLLPARQIAFSTAQAYRLQYFADRDPGWLRRAIELYRRYVAETPEGGRRVVAITHLAELEPLLARIEAAPGGEPVASRAAPATQLMITSATAGARGRVTRGGDQATERPDQPVPVVVDLEPGSYRVHVSAPGHLSETRTALAVEGKLVVVEVTLRASPARLDVTADAGAEIVVDGRPVGVAPLIAPLELSPGSHFVAVTRRGHRPWARQLELVGGRTERVAVDLRPTPRRVAARIALGVAAGALVASGATAVVMARADSRATALEQQRATGSLTLGELDEYERARRRRDGMRTATIAGLGVAVLTGVASGLLYVLDDTATPRPRPHKALVVAPWTSSPGLSVRAHFW